MKKDYCSQGAEDNGSLYREIPDVSSAPAFKELVLQFTVLKYFQSKARLCPYDTMTKGWTPILKSGEMGRLNERRYFCTYRGKKSTLPQ